MISRRGFLGLGLAGVAGAVTAGRATAKPGSPPDIPPTAVAYTTQIVDQNVFRHPTLASANGDPVGVQLCLVSDTSSSMTEEEYELELKAMAMALNSPLFRQAVKYKAADNSVAVCLLDFSDLAKMRMPWVDIRGEAINDFPFNPDEPLGKTSQAPDVLDAIAYEIMTMPRHSGGGTSIYAALTLGQRLFANCPWQATERKVIDVFSDGTQDGGPTLMTQASLELAQSGVTVNAFAIVNPDTPGLEQYYRDYLIQKEGFTGPDGIRSEPGMVWAVAKGVVASGNTTPVIEQYIEDVLEGMKQKIVVETAGLRGYFNSLAALGETPHAPVPLPVAPARSLFPRIFG